MEVEDAWGLISLALVERTRSSRVYNGLKLYADIFSQTQTHNIQDRIKQTTYFAY